MGDTAPMRSIAIIVALAACSPSPAAPAPAITVRPAPLPPCPVTPAAVAPAIGNEAVFTLPAVGVQSYVCLAGGVWSAAVPSAALGASSQLAALLGDLTWRTEDVSAVRGSVSGSAVVDATAIPWARFNVVEHTGPTGVMSPIVQVQRLSTSGGRAPGVSCSPGAQAHVPYAATYWFYRVTAEGGSGVRCGG